jgi:hypothetical protein
MARKWVGWLKSRDKRFNAIDLLARERPGGGREVPMRGDAFAERVP